MDDRSHLTKDTLFEGRLNCWQNKEGYRFSIDSVLLAHFCLHWKDAKILDIGCGSGILSLILMYRNSKNILNINGLEYQEQLVQLARLNVKENNFDGKITITHGDFNRAKSLFDAEVFSHVICNPPFYPEGSGRISSNKEAYFARHQQKNALENLTAAIALVLKNRGVAAMIYPSDRFTEMLAQLIERRLQPKTLRFIYSYPEAREASLVLIECRKNGGRGCSVLSPLCIYKRKNGDYTDEVEGMYQP